jgi:dihydropteroate synthase
VSLARRPLVEKGKKTRALLPHSRYYFPMNPAMKPIEALARKLADPGARLIMGVVNATPDSFYAASRVGTVEEAIARAHSLQAAGADIIDIGGESTRPGAVPVSPDEECMRVLPVIEALNSISLPISIDTRHALVAERALAAGASIINDITALADPAMRRLAAESGAFAVLMHMQGQPATMQQAPRYDNAADEVEAFFRARMEEALAAGIASDKLWLDPGIGFGKRLEDNLALIAAIPRFVKLQSPILMGFSRKSFITHVLGAPPGADAGVVGANMPVAETRMPCASMAQIVSDSDKLLATSLYNFAALSLGAKILRVHDAREAAIAIRVWRSLGGAPQGI